MNTRASSNKRPRSEHPLFPSSPSRSARSQELVEVDEELNELHANLSQFNYKLLLAARLVWPAHKYLEKVIDELSSIFLKTSHILQHLHSVQSHLLCKDTYVIKFANILSRFKKRINESGIFPQVVKMDKVRYNVATLENRSDWLVVFHLAIRNALDKMEATEEVKDQFWNLIKAIEVLQDLTNQYMQKRTALFSAQSINTNRRNPSKLFASVVVKEKESAAKIQKTETVNSVLLESATASPRSSRSPK